MCRGKRSALAGHSPRGGLSRHPGPAKSLPQARRTPKRLPPRSTWSTRQATATRSALSPAPTGGSIDRLVRRRKQGLLCGLAIPQALKGHFGRPAHWRADHDPPKGYPRYTRPDGKALLVSAYFNGNEPGTLTRIDFGNVQMKYPADDLGGAGQFSGRYLASPDGTQLVMGTANLGNELVPRSEDSLVVVEDHGGGPPPDRCAVGVLHRGRHCPNDVSVVAESVVFEEYSESGGAHPVTGYHSFNYDLGKGAPITLDTLFKPDSTPVDVLDPIVQRQMDKHWTGYGGPAPKNTLGARVYQNFAITDDAVIFFISQGMWLPEVAGPQKVSYPARSSHQYWPSPNRCRRSTHGRRRECRLHQPMTRCHESDCLPQRLRWPTAGR